MYSSADKMTVRFFTELGNEVTINQIRRQRRIVKSTRELCTTNLGQAYTNTEQGRQGQLLNFRQGKRLNAGLWFSGQQNYGKAKDY
jgi:hypothetical protein